VLDPFDDQHLALAAKPAAVFVFWRRRPDHGADARFATFVSQQRANQGLAVDLVGLRTPSTTRRRNRGWIDDVAFDAFALQNAVNPKPIKSRLLNHDSGERLTGPRQRLLFEFCKARE
jgi:hypothetical protein